MSEVIEYILSDLRSLKDQEKYTQTQIKKGAASNKYTKCVLFLLAINVAMLAMEYGTQKKEIMDLKKQIDKGE